MRLALLALPLVACGHPFEPGSDLPAESPPAVLSDTPPPAAEPPPAPAPDLDPAAALDGIYVIDSTLQSPLGDVINARFEGHVTQAGVIGEGATLMIELRDPAEADVPGPGFPEPVPLGPDGAFAGTVPGMVVSPRFSDLLAAPAAAEVALDGAPLAPDCLAGRLDLALIDAQTTVVDGPISLSLEGRFTAERAPGACPDGGP